MTNLSLRASLLVGFAVVAMVAIAPDSSAQGSTPALDAAQKQKLARIQAQFVPGAKDRNWSLGFDKVAETCGATIPMTIDPSTVALEKMDGDRTGIPSVCRELAESVIYTCGDQDDADPVVKEMMRGGVKKMVCAASASEAELGGSVKYALDAQGTLTMTYGPNPSGVREKGRTFLQKNVKKNGLSIGGRMLKRKMLDQLSKNTLPKRLADECGMNVSVSVDDRLAEDYSNHIGHSAISGCLDGMQAIYNFCGRADEFGRGDVKSFAQKNVKAIACTYGENSTLELKNGTLFVATSDAAPSPKWQSRYVTLVEYDMEWMKANFVESKASSSSSTSARRARR